MVFTGIAGITAVDGTIIELIDLPISPPGIAPAGAR
jgi:hypothetical protein